MIEKPMKSLAVGEVKYIITDAEAREDIETLQTNVGNINTDITEIDGEVADLKSHIDEIDLALEFMPEQQTTTSNNDDLDIADESGNVLARFVDGHIKTKKFDSENIEIFDAIESVSVTGEQSLDIADINGNVLARFEGGNIKTQNFDSDAHFLRQRKTYRLVTDGYNMTATTLTLNQQFKVGSKLMFFACISGQEDTSSISSGTITFNAVNSMGGIQSVSGYGYDYLVMTLTSDAEYVSVNLPSNLAWDTSSEIEVFIYQYFDDPSVTKTITVKQDGSGDFTGIRAALDSITDNNLVTRYIVEVYPGTYNVLEDYTQAEIEDENFVGLIVGNGVTMRGVGQRDDIIISGTLDEETYTSSNRNQVSTLNMTGSCGLENMTILASYIRYCVHDDKGARGKRLCIFKNLILSAHDLTSNSIYDVTYGAGYGNAKNGIWENVDFGDVCLVHGSEDWTESPFLYFRDCKARIFSFTGVGTVENMYITLDNCKATTIRLRSGTTQTLRIDGAGTDCIVDCSADCVYNIGQCHKFEESYNFTVGQAVKVGTNYNLSATTTKVDMYGIVLGKLDGNTYVQCGGYINSNTFGISGLSVGDYLTLDSNGILTDGGTAENAIGVVISTSTLEGGAIIKMI